VTDSCIGLDPGEVTGICLLDYDAGVLTGTTILQVDAGSAVGVLQAVLTVNHPSYRGRRVASVEKWVEGSPAAARGRPAKVTRQLVMALAEMCEMFGYAVRLRPAADVKPWGSDKRLVAAGIAEKEQALHGKLRDGYDAARHALYGAHEAGIARDPLRRKTAVPLGNAPPSGVP
jgi:hypothetical protein